MSNAGTTGRPMFHVVKRAIDIPYPPSDVLQAYLARNDKPLEDYLRGVLYQLEGPQGYIVYIYKDVVMAYPGVGLPLWFLALVETGHYLLGMVGTFYFAASIPPMV